MIVTEADKIWHDNEPLRAAFNSGYTRGAGVLRCVGEDNTPHVFPTFCPRVIDMIGRDLPDTTQTRCIGIAVSASNLNESAPMRRSSISARLTMQVFKNCGERRCAGQSTMVKL